MIETFESALAYLLEGSSTFIAYVLMISAAAMFVTWALAYILIIIKCFREHTYGVPLLAACLNISWEAQMSVAPPESYPGLLKIGNHMWLIPDLLVLYLIYRFGRSAQSRLELKPFFFATLTGTLVFSFFLVLTFRTYFNDPYGVAAAFLLALIMSLLFILMAFDRPAGRGLSYGAAWLMMIGNVVAAVFCYYWWPMQFQIGRLDASLEPPSYTFLYILYAIIPAFNVVYIVQLRRIRKRYAIA